MPCPKTVVLSGDLDIFGIAAVRAALENMHGRCIVDLREVRYLDCSVLTELARLARRIGPREGTLVVASANIRRVLGIVRFEQLFTIVDVLRPSEVVRHLEVVRSSFDYHAAAAVSVTRGLPLEA